MIPSNQFADHIDKESAEFAYALSNPISSERVMVYRENDLKASLQRANAASHYYATFHGHLTYRRHVDRGSLLVDELTVKFDAKMKEVSSQIYQKLKDELKDW